MPCYDFVRGAAQVTVMLYKKTHILLAVQIKYRKSPSVRPVTVVSEQVSKKVIRKLRER